jgi:hypothetical protein
MGSKPKIFVATFEQGIVGRLVRSDKNGYLCRQGKDSVAPTYKFVDSREAILVAQDRKMKPGTCADFHDGKSYFYFDIEEDIYGFNKKPWNYSKTKGDGRTYLNAAIGQFKLATGRDMAFLISEFSRGFPKLGNRPRISGYWFCEPAYGAIADTIVTEALTRAKPFITLES